MTKASNIPQNSVKNQDCATEVASFKEVSGLFASKSDSAAEKKDSSEPESATKSTETASPDSIFKTDSGPCEQNSSNCAENSKISGPVDEISPFEAHISRDLKEFSRLYPNVSLSALVGDECLILYANGKENQPFTSVYRDFCALCDKIEQRALEKASHALSLSNSTPGSLSSPSSPDDGFFTKEQVLRMSSAEISRNYDKIRKSQERW